MKRSAFDKWWESDGKYFDPDWDDVPWFDKRRELAEYAWHRARAYKSAAILGAIKSPRKAESSAINGKLGGRPKKITR